MKNLHRLVAVCAASAVMALAAPLAAVAAPISYGITNIAADTPYAQVNALIGSLNSGFPFTAGTVSASGTTTATAAGLKVQISITGLTTAAGVTAATMTVTNTSVAAASFVFCQTNGYAGTGNPNVVNVVPAAGTFTFAIQNSHASAALNATVPVSCMVYN